MGRAEILYRSAGFNTVIVQHQVQLAFRNFSAGKCGSYEVHVRGNKLQHVRSILFNYLEVKKILSFSKITTVAAR